MNEVLKLLLLQWDLCSLYAFLVCIPVSVSFSFPHANSAIIFSFGTLLTLLVFFSLTFPNLKKMELLSSRQLKVLAQYFS